MYVCLFSVVYVCLFSVVCMRVCFCCVYVCLFSVACMRVCFVLCVCVFVLFFMCVSTASEGSGEEGAYSGGP